MKEKFLPKAKSMPRLDLDPFLGTEDSSSLSSKSSLQFEDSATYFSTAPNHKVINFFVRWVISPWYFWNSLFFFILCYSFCKNFGCEQCICKIKWVPKSQVLNKIHIEEIIFPSHIYLLNLLTNFMISYGIS